MLWSALWSAIGGFLGKLAGVVSTALAWNKAGKYKERADNAEGEVEALDNLHEQKEKYRAAGGLGGAVARSVSDDTEDADEV